MVLGVTYNQWLSIGLQLIINYLQLTLKTEPNIILCVWGGARRKIINPNHRVEDHTMFRNYILKQNTMFK